MTDDDQSGRAISGNLGVLAVAVVAVTAAVIGGMAMAGNGTPTADEVLDDARDRYESAENVAGTAVVTVENENGTVERSAEVTFTVTDDNESRVAVTASNRTAVVGSNGSVGWVHLEEAGLTQVVELPDDPDEWSGMNASGPAIDGNLTTSIADAAEELRERHGDLVPAADEWNASQKPHPKNLSDGDYEWNLSEGGVDWNLSDGDHDWNLSGGDHDWNLSDGDHEWNASGDWNRSVFGTTAWDWTRENASAERVGTETVGETEAHLIEIEPAGDGEGVLRIWIGTDDSRVLKTELTRGDWTATVRYTNLQFDVSLADSTFQPPGAGPTETTAVDSREELQTTTDFDVPAAPEQYTFVEGSTVVYGDATVAIGSYTGPENVTVATTTADQLPVDAVSDVEANASTVELAGQPATVADSDRGVVVSWERDGVRNAVIVEGSRETAVSVAESIIDGSE